MIAKYLVPAVAVLGSAAAQCTQSTATINSPADATALASSCKTFNGNILVNTGASGQVDFPGLAQIKGDLIAESAGLLNGLSSSTLNSISGKFRLFNLTGLSSLSFTSLSNVGSIEWTSLTALDTLTLGTPGITTAKSILIADTFLPTLDGIDATSLTDLNINNNHRLVKWESPLSNLSNVMNFLANGNDLELSFPSLTWIANMTIFNVTSFAVPVLQTINGTATFETNPMDSFNAPNLTSTKFGSLNFVSNPKLKNITAPQLTSLAGAILIANNTALGKIDGFPKLKSVGGDVKLRGNFTDVDFPSLNDVKGAFDVSSTNDISGACDKFQKLAPSKQGGGGQIQGVYHCESNNAQANSDTGGNTSSSGTTGGGGKSGGNSAAGVAINAAMLGLAVVGGMVALL